MEAGLVLNLLLRLFLYMGFLREREKGLVFFINGWGFKITEIISGVLGK